MRFYFRGYAFHFRVHNNSKLDFIFLPFLCTKLWFFTIQISYELYIQVFKVSFSKKLHWLSFDCDKVSINKLQGRVVTYNPSQTFADPEQLRQCPFDPVHTIQAYRYQRHILRCRKQNPEKARDFVKCKFNSMHWYHKTQIQAHHEECVDRIRHDQLLDKSRFR